jgi:phospho-N-acetylmuramoyl-pentapeptide-transferase
MHYLSIGFLCSFFITFLSIKYGIRLLREWQGKGQPIRDDGPQTHLKKAGTPTMGGIFIIACTTISSLIFCSLTKELMTILFVMLSYGFIGFMDDYAKVKKQNSKGIRAKLRLLLEFIVAAAVIFFLNPPTSINIPFCVYEIELRIFYYILASIAIVGSANATNLTDGLDGLLSGPVIMVFTCFLASCYMIVSGIYPEGKYGLSLNNDAIINLMMFCVLIIGVFLGFLWYNVNPAKIFMGDVGSLAVGGIIGTIAVMLRQEIYLVIIGGVFVVEALSVIIQVFSYKTRKKRVFLMAPIHHHFEKMGLDENTVVMRFWIVSLILCVLGMLLTTM